MLRRPVPLCIAALSMACGDPAAPDPTPIWELIVERGNLQQGPVATILPEALLVQLRRGGAPATGEIITVRVLTGDGTIWIPGFSPVAGVGAALSERTGIDGRAELFLGVGETPGDYQFAVTTARIASGDSIFPVTVTAVPGPPATTAAEGDQQSGAAGGVLTAPLGVLVTDAFGNVIADVPVRWMITGGTGQLADTLSLTDPDGRAAMTWTLGSEIGMQSVEAVVDTLPPVMFSATAN